MTDHLPDPNSGAKGPKDSETNRGRDMTSDDSSTGDGLEFVIDEHHDLKPLPAALDRLIAEMRDSIRREQVSRSLKRLGGQRWHAASDVFPGVRGELFSTKLAYGRDFIAERDAVTGDTGARTCPSCGAVEASVGPCEHLLAWDTHRAAFASLRLASDRLFDSVEAIERARWKWQEFPTDTPSDGVSS